MPRAVFLITRRWLTDRLHQTIDWGIAAIEDARALCADIDRARRDRDA